MKIQIQPAVLQGDVMEAPISPNIEYDEMFRPTYLLALEDTFWGLNELRDFGGGIRVLRCNLLTKGKDRDGMPLYYDISSLYADIFVDPGLYMNAFDPLKGLLPDGSVLCWRNDVEWPEKYNRARALLRQAYRDVLAQFGPSPTAGICFLEPDLSEPVIQTDVQAFWCPINRVWRSALPEARIGRRPFNAWIVQGRVDLPTSIGDPLDEPDCLIVDPQFVDSGVWVPEHHGYEPVKRLVAFGSTCQDGRLQS